MSGSSVNKPHFLCRVIGHKWRPTHRLDKDKYGLGIWVYIEHICVRCYCRDWQMPYAENYHP